MNKPTKLALSLVCVSVLSACSFDDDKPAPAPVVDTPPPPPPTYLLSGTVTGLNGELSVTAGEEEVTVTQDGAIAFTTEFNSGDIVTASITAAPDLQECAITSDTEFTFDNADIDALAVECRDLELYAAVADSAETADDAAVTIDVLANDTSEYAETFELLEVTEPANGTAAISENKITYTPTEGFAGTDTFSYTGTDGAQEASAEVTVTVSQTVSIAGRVTDAPLANATVTLTINGETYTATTNEDGDYVLDLSMTDLSSNSRPRLSATGAGEQSYITLSSRLPSILAMLDAAGEDRTLERSESNQVQVTQLSTAENLLLEVLAQGEDITDETMRTLQTEFDINLMLEMAAVIKLLADDPDYQLPEGFETIEAFLADKEAYNTFVEEAGTAGDLQAALDETLNDPEVAEPVAEEGLAAYYGNYLSVYSSSRYTGREAYESFSISEEGMNFSGDVVENLTQAADGSYDFEAPGRDSYVNTTYDWFVSNNITMDDATATAFAAYWNQYGYINSDTTYVPVNVKFLHRGTSSIIVDITEELRFEEFRFTWENVVYTIPAQVYGERSYVLTWVDVESLASGAEFDIADGSKWLLPLSYNIHHDMPTYPVYAWSGTQLVTLNTTNGMSGEFTNELTGDTGTWQLSEDKQELTYGFTVNERTAEFSVRYARYDEHSTELVIKEVYSSPETTERTRFVLYTGGNVDTTMTTADLKPAPEEISVALLSMYRSDFWTDNGPNLEHSYVEWMYGWHFAADQSVTYYDGACEKDQDYNCMPGSFYWQGVPYASLSDLSWELADDYLHIARPNSHTAPGCVGALECGGRFVAPVRMNSETGIITVLEMDLYGSGSPWYLDDIVEGGIYQNLEPRINYWYHMPFDGVANQPSGTVYGTQSLKTPTSNYKKVLHWEQRPSREH